MTKREILDKIKKLAETNKFTIRVVSTYKIYLFRENLNLPEIEEFIKEVGKLVDFITLEDHLNNKRVPKVKWAELYNAKKEVAGATIWL